MNRPTRFSMTFVTDPRKLSNRIHAGFPQGIAQKHLRDKQTINRIVKENRRGINSTPDAINRSFPP
jgi:hypothetical protein